MTKQTRKGVRRPGRPKLPAGAGKRHPLNVRTTKEIRLRLEDAAKRSGRSLTQEAELRLEQSFRRDDEQLETWGGRAEREAWLACARAANSLAAKSGKGWLEDAQTLQRTHEATVGLQGLLGPDGPKFEKVHDTKGIEEAVTVFIKLVKTRHGLDLLDPEVLKRIKLREDGFSEAVEALDNIL